VCSSDLRVIAEKGDFGLARSLKGSFVVQDQVVEEEKTDESETRTESVREEGS